MKVYTIVKSKNVLSIHFVFREHYPVYSPPTSFFPFIKFPSRRDDDDESVNSSQKPSCPRLTSTFLSFSFVAEKFLWIRAHRPRPTTSTVSTTFRPVPE